MGFLDEIREIIRRNVTGDKWYVNGDRLYVLELRAPPLPPFFIAPVTYIVLPLGLQSYRISRVYRAAATPTIGGLVAEERGELWKKISIRWDPGIEPKKSLDTSFLPDIYMPGFALSGPAWSRRLVRNYFDNYSKLKADPQSAKDTYMIWHDLKTDDHYVVMPTEATIERTVAARMRYPVNMEFTTLGPASGIILPPSPSNLLATARGVLSDINKGIALIGSAIQEGSAILGEIRTIAAEIGTVITNLQIIVDSAQDFADGVTDTLSIGQDFLKSTSALMDDVLGELEDDVTLPDGVRQNLMSGQDGVHTIAAAKAVFKPSYGTVAGAIETTEQGPAGRATAGELDAAAGADPPQSANAFGTTALTSSSKVLVSGGAVPTPREFAKYASFSTYIVRAGDSLQSIAADKLLDGSLWYDLAVLNNLKPPYISLARLPDTVTVGSKIRIPQLTTGQTQLDQPDDSIYFTDFEWAETGLSRPGRPKVSFGVDRRTFKDAKFISGIDNLGQALQLRVWTARGTIPADPNYGQRRLIGLNITGANIELITLNYRENIGDDPRVQLVKNINIEIPEGHPDQVDVEVDVIPVGGTESTTIRTVVI